MLKLLTMVLGVILTSGTTLYLLDLPSEQVYLDIPVDKVDPNMITYDPASVYPQPEGTPMKRLFMDLRTFTAERVITWNVQVYDPDGDDLGSILVSDPNDNTLTYIKDAAIPGLYTLTISRTVTKGLQYVTITVADIPKAEDAPIATRSGTYVIRGVGNRPPVLR